MPALSLLDLLPFAFQYCLFEAFWIGKSELFGTALPFEALSLKFEC